MSALHVCGLQRAPSLAREIGAAAMISILHAEQSVPTPDGIAPDAHLRLVFDDVAHHDPRRLVPAEAHVDALIAFVARCDLRRPLLVHCMLGMSRSPAAALIALCWLNPGREDEVAAALRAAAPFAAPNARLVRLAAERLGRPAIAAALAAMGPIDRSAPVPFQVPLRLPRPDDQPIWGA